jgi:hypothetical protein
MKTLEKLNSLVNVHLAMESAKVCP